MSYRTSPIDALARAFGTAGVFGERRDGFTSADLANGGLLSPEQLKPFLAGIYDSTPIYKMASVVNMTSPQYEISRLSFGDRILKKPPAELSEVGAAQLTKPTTGKTTLDYHELRGEVQLSYEAVEQNIEKEGFIDRTLNDIGAESGVDIAQNAMRGDTSLPLGVSDDQDALAQFDGWRVQALSQGHVYDAANANVDMDLLRAIYSTMPAKYLQSSAMKMQFLAQYGIGLDWRSSFGARATVGGDLVLQHALTAPPFYGRPVVESAEINTYTNDGQICGDIFFTDPENLVIGIGNEIQVRVVDWPVAEMVRILVRVKMDCGFRRPDAVVIAKNIALRA